LTTVITVACYGGESLRDVIVHDVKLERYGLQVSRQKHLLAIQDGRSHTSDYETAGAINLEWDAGTRTLLARIVTRGRRTPDEIVGRLVAYLLGRYQQRIRSIRILPN
jgi:hypothetical protein